MGERPQHPSGRPVRKEAKPVGSGRWNIPNKGSVLPRLQEQSKVSAIGFIATHLPGHQDYEDD
jgi:hypothetical protein